MNWFLATQRDKEQVNPLTTRPATGSDRVKEYPPTTSLKVSSDYGHLWHPDSYGTQFTNDTLTITVNGLSLNKDWYDPRCFPLGTNREKFDAQSLQIVTQLVAADKAAHMVRSRKGAQMANINEATEDTRVPTNATALVAQVKSGAKRDDMELLTPPSKKPRLVLNSKEG
ncbi:hypothetical protein C1H46_012586 [Malus baccata]|uniref:Uncharacterized protein n=1 Tax=Malus baccata TaxID=106549 RepID=A0A540MSK4_MALBA|nr:hypothetical protein C1H46_012586 [Malus baccata]